MVKIYAVQALSVLVLVFTTGKLTGYSNAFFVFALFALLSATSFEALCAFLLASLNQVISEYEVEIDNHAYPNGSAGYIFPYVNN